MGQPIPHTHIAHTIPYRLSQVAMVTNFIAIVQILQIFLKRNVTINSQSRKLNKLSMWENRSQMTKITINYPTHFGKHNKPPMPKSHKYSNLGQLNT